MVVALLTTLSAYAQNVTWGAPTTQEIAPNEYRVAITGRIAQGWKIYDMRSYMDGPNPTALTLLDQSDATPLSPAQSVEEATIIYDKIFAQDIGYYTDEVTIYQDVRVERSATIPFELEWMSCNANTCTPPEHHQFEVTITNSDSSLWLLIIEAILWGFAALLTPCVFPMVPMTISFFLKGNKSPAQGRIAALLYALFIVALYTLPIAAIIAITYLFGGDAVTANIFNWIATHWLPNVIFFVVFIAFAASFFGAFEMTLPSKWVNQSDSRADKGSLAGIFFLALTLVLVSFSCTGPIVGSVLIKSTQGEVWSPIITMLAFSCAFALPFGLVALFPALMQRMPRSSGGWLSSVKVLLGFVELALGLKFLSVADQSYQWGILPREIYLALWIVIFSLMGLYLLGKLRFKHEAAVEHIGFMRLILAILTLSFVVYLLPGMWGAPLRPLAGYLPPPTTIEREMVQTTIISHDRPQLIYLTGHGCVNCREMEQRVWSDPAVKELLAKYEVVKLYMDERTQLPQNEWVTTPEGRTLKSLGQVNSYTALKQYGVNAQPYYIILGREGKELLPPRGYNLNIEEYITFLEQGIERYNRQ